MDEISLRTRKCAIIAEDDALPNGDTHHAQLRATWTELMGCEPSAPDRFFGPIDEMLAELDPATARFAAFAHHEYSRTLGPWLAIEGLAHGWIEALCDALKVHFPAVETSPYFVGNLASGVEQEHAASSLELFEIIAARRPHIVNSTIEAVLHTAQELDLFWTGCCELL